MFPHDSSLAVVSASFSWKGTYDEYVPRNSDRFAPRNTYTDGPHRPKAAADSLYRIERTNSIGAPSTRGAVGLKNLGNTCFMNSTLQCLSNIPYLTEYFVDEDYRADKNLQNALGWGGRVADEWAGLLKQMWSGQYKSVSPAALKQILGEIQPRFFGNQQHDSSELLSFLLDGLHEDLNRVHKKPPTETVERLVGWLQLL